MGGGGRREYPRFAMEATVDLVGPDSPPLSGSTRNLSRGGLCLELSQLDDGVAPPVAGTDITVRITLLLEAYDTSEPLTLPARVAWSTPLDDGHQVGCQFAPLTREQQNYIDMFLRYLEEAGVEPESDAESGASASDDPFER